MAKMQSNPAGFDESLITLSEADLKLLADQAAAGALGPGTDEFDSARVPWMPLRRSEHEHPEYAYRRGYQQGAREVVRALEGRVDPALWRSLNAFVRKVGKWRYGKRARQREVMRDQAPRFTLSGGTT
jgi:hypothetical protein